MTDAGRLRGPAAYGASVALHAALFAALLLARPPPERRADPVEVQIVETVRPPPPPPPRPAPSPPAPTSPLRARLQRFVKEPPPAPPDAPPPPPRPDDAPPPPNDAAPPGAKPGPVRIGVTMQSTTIAGGFAAPTGNTAYGKAPPRAEAPGTAQPYTAERYVPPTQVTTLPQVERCEPPRDEYPVEARRQQREAEVKLRLVIDEEGRVRDVRALGDPGYGFAAAAVESVRRHCRFRPAMKDGQKVATEITYTFRYVLD
ncbi:MAG TPA: energy transducer TonB [Anaeromyxobacteraceae bacterium]|nr:energy transducer TonB [Anaeromyxobacteraceae bacterium]